MDLKMCVCALVFGVNWGHEHVFLQAGVDTHGDIPNCQVQNLPWNWIFHLSKMCPSKFEPFWSFPHFPCCEPIIGLHTICWWMSDVYACKSGTWAFFPVVKCVVKCGYTLSGDTHIFTVKSECPRLTPITCMGEEGGVVATSWTLLCAGLMCKYFHS